MIYERTFAIFLNLCLFRTTAKSNGNQTSPTPNRITSSLHPPFWHIQQKFILYLWKFIWKKDDIVFVYSLLTLSVSDMCTYACSFCRILSKYFDISSICLLTFIICSRDRLPLKLDHSLPDARFLRAMAVTHCRPQEMVSSGPHYHSPSH